MPSYSYTIDPVLQTYTVAAMQDKSAFCAAVAAPDLPVDRYSAKYYTYDQGAWNRIAMKKRGPGEESEGDNWSWSYDSYTADRYAVHYDDDYNESAKMDSVIDPRNDASDYLANQALMFRESLFVTNCFGPSLWTTDWDGASSSPSLGTSVLQWNDSSADAQKDVSFLKQYIKTAIGKPPNGKWVGVIGSTAYTYLLVQPAFRSAIQYNMPTDYNKMQDSAAGWLGVDSLVVLDGVYNSAKEGQTKSMAFIGNAKDFALYFVNDSVTPKSITAAKTFCWTGPKGAGKNGIVTSAIDMSPTGKTKVRYECEYYFDVKVVSADCGGFIDGVVA